VPLFLLALLSVETALSPTAPAEAAYRGQIEKWRSERIRLLTADDGWLTVIALSWLEPGDNSIGAATTNRIVLPAAKAPPLLGRIRLAGGKARLEVASGVEVTHDGAKVQSLDLASDEGGKPTIVRHGTLSFYLIKRGEKLGVRVKDSANTARKSFHGIDSYPVDSEWRLDARFEPYPPKKAIAIPNILGTVSQEPSPGAVVFQIGGKEYRLDAVDEQGEDEMFLIFGDRTNGTETYGAGRFLYAPRPGRDGKTVVDFNKAYNPPCAFTPFATCPLPPPQNRLPIAVEAGEKRYGTGSGLH
jgi:uncharacterized protein (DUF1684 family)